MELPLLLRQVWGKKAESGQQRRLIRGAHQNVFECDDVRVIDLSFRDFRLALRVPRLRRELLPLKPDPDRRGNTRSLPSQNAVCTRPLGMQGGLV